MFDLNGLKLPLGFMVFLLFVRKPKVNADTKYIAVSVGLVLFILGIFIPQIEKMVYERTHHIDLLDTNFYSGSLVEEVENLRDYLDMEGYSLELRGLDMTIHQDGTYESLGIGLVEQTHQGQINYIIDLADDRKSLEVVRYKVKDEEYLKDYIFTDAELVLGNFDLITSEMLEKKEYDYYHFSTDGQRIDYAVADSRTFQISTAGKAKLENDQLPVQAIVVDVCKGKELDELRTPFKCRDDEQFLLDVLMY